MKILVACEESQAVTIELRRLGHEAYSCDIIPCSGGHPEWHIMQNVLPLLNGNCSFKTMDGTEHSIETRWDMIIAFPPCTKTSNAGARHLWKGGKLNIERYYDGLCGKALFLAIWAADCEKVVIENPTPSRVFEYPEPSQAIQPYEYGHPFTKKTLLWERGVPLLMPTNIVTPERTWCPSGSCALPGFVDSKNEEKTERNAGYLVVSQSGGGMLRQGTREGIRRTPANRGMRAHRIVKGLDISEDVCHGMCP